MVYTFLQYQRKGYPRFLHSSKCGAEWEGELVGLRSHKWSENEVRLLKFLVITTTAIHDVWLKRAMLYLIILVLV